MKTVEYRVRPVTRYIVTRWMEDGDPEGGNALCGSSCRGEFDRADNANEVALALGECERRAAEYSVSVVTEPVEQDPAP